MRPTPPRRGPWLLPPAYFLLFNALLAAVDKFWPIISLTPMPWGWLGLIPVALGTAVCIIAAWQFHRHRTTIVPFRPSHVLMTGGVFRFSRNPIYAAMVLIMAGIAVLAGSLGGWLVPPLFAASLHWRFIRPEERMLAAQFGPAYEAYRRRVRRWI